MTKVRYEITIRKEEEGEEEIKTNDSGYKERKG